MPFPHSHPDGPHNLLGHGDLKPSHRKASLTPTSNPGKAPLPVLGPQPLGLPLSRHWPQWSVTNTDQHGAWHVDTGPGATPSGTLQGHAYPTPRAPLSTPLAALTDQELVLKVPGLTLISLPGLGEKALPRRPQCSGRTCRQRVGAAPAEELD